MSPLLLFSRHTATKGHVHLFELVGEVLEWVLSVRRDGAGADDREEGKKYNHRSCHVRPE